MALVFMVSGFGCINGMVLAGARAYYAMALDGSPAEDTPKNPSVEDQAILDAYRAQLLAEAKADDGGGA